MRRFLIAAIVAAAALATTGGIMAATPAPPGSVRNLPVIPVRVKVVRLNQQDALAAGLDPAAVKELADPIGPSVVVQDKLEGATSPVRRLARHRQVESSGRYPSYQSAGPFYTSGCYKVYFKAGGVSSLDGKEIEHVSPAWCYYSYAWVRSTNTSDHWEECSFLYSCNGENPPSGGPMATIAGCSTGCSSVQFRETAYFTLFAVWPISDTIVTKTYLDCAGYAQFYWQYS